MTDQATAVIRAYDDGPLLVRGEFELQTQDGHIIDSKRQTVALCRCGKSALKPFCDGSHRPAGFRATTSARRVRPLDGESPAGA